jgi:3-methyladenine DNA glycosylase Mpg
LGITRKQNGADLISGALHVRQQRAEPHLTVETTPRIGITHCADWPLRFVVAGSPFVSGKIALQAVRGTGSK